MIINKLLGGGGAAAPLVATALFAVCHGLNYKGLHDFEKRLIISKLLGGGGCNPLSYGPVRMCNWRGHI
jgi:hypothetical protein